MEEDKVVIKHRGRRFKRSSINSNGPLVVKAIQSENGTTSQFQPDEQRGSQRDMLVADEPMKPPSAALFKSGLFSLPPAEPPLVTSRGRPPSAKGRSRPTSRSSSHSPVRKTSKGSKESSVVGQDSFHKLQPLPAIGNGRYNIRDHTAVGEYSISDDSAIDMSSNNSSSLETTSSSHLLSISSFANIQHIHEPVIKARKSSQEEHILHKTFRVSEIMATLPSKLSIDTKKKTITPEPSLDEPNCVVLAIKLLDGTRVERRFRQTDLLADVMLVAQHHSPQPLPACELSTNDVPKRLLSDYGMTLQQAGLSVRTMIILSEL